MNTTRELIFDVAVRLFADIGYEQSNMRDIAKLSKIKASSIYNHYKSKAQILENIYQYYQEHFFDNMKSDQEIKEAIDTGESRKILRSLQITFESPDLKKYQRMVLITKIIVSRIFIDHVAYKIFSSTMTKDIEEILKKHLNYGIKQNKIKPINIETFSSLIVGGKLMMGIKAFSAPDYRVGQLEVEDKIDELFSSLLEK